MSPTACNFTKNCILSQAFLKEVMLIASAKSRRVRKASHQPAFVSSCLTISHTFLPCLPTGRVYPCVSGVIEGNENAGVFVDVRSGWVGSVWNL